jgi:hypothetical protein
VRRAVRIAAQRVRRAMTEPKDDTVRSLIVAAHDEILSEPAETDEKRTREASE